MIEGKRHQSSSMLGLNDKVQYLVIKREEVKHLHLVGDATKTMEGRCNSADRSRHLFTEYCFELRLGTPRVFSSSVRQTRF